MTRTTMLGLAIVSITLIPASARKAVAITTSGGQTWDAVPDAWVRANDTSTAYFGWDVFEPNGVALSFGEVLDDTSPDLGPTTTAVNTRIFQGADGVNDHSPTAYGHLSGSGNYYSGFGAADVADDTITGQAPAGGSGGYTTVVLQVIGGAPGGQGAQPLESLSFDILESGWTKEKDLYGRLPTGTGLYWQEWTSAGGNLPFSIRMTSAVESRSIDAFQIDTFWSPSGPVLNARSSIGIPEPTIGVFGLSGLVFVGALGLRRQEK